MYNLKKLICKYVHETESVPQRQNCYCWSYQGLSCWQPPVRSAIYCCWHRLFGPDFALLKGCIYEFAQCIQDKRVVTGEKKFKCTSWFHFTNVFIFCLWYWLCDKCSHYENFSCFTGLKIDIRQLYEIFIMIIQRGFSFSFQIVQWSSHFFFISGWPRTLTSFSGSGTWLCLSKSKMLTTNYIRNEKCMPPLKQYSTNRVKKFGSKVVAILSFLMKNVICGFWWWKWKKKKHYTQLNMLLCCLVLFYVLTGFTSQNATNVEQRGFYQPL